MDKQIYRLIGVGAPNRVRELTRDQALGLNVTIKGSGHKWVLDPGATPGEVNEPGIPNISSDERKRRHANGLLRDRLETKAAQIQKEATTMAKTTTTRGEWNGLSQCQVIRICGSRGLDKVVTRQVCEKAGLKPADGTISIQLGKGRKHEDIPDLKPELLSDLLGEHLPKPKKKETADERRARKAARKAKRAAQTAEVAAA
jgi:hypothetical protein